MTSHHEPMKACAGSGPQALTAELARQCLAIVPARAGSKGIPGKNLRNLAGQPLIAHTLRHARKAGLGAVVLSTEDEEIAAVGRSSGYDVPFLRPPELARDDSPTLPVLLHMLQALRAAGDPRSERKWVVLLQPTSPLRQAHWITQCVQLLASGSADSAMTVVRVPSEHHPLWAYRPCGEGRVELLSGGNEPISRRQDLPPVFHREGSVYVVSRRVLEEQQTLYGQTTLALEVPAELSINLDTPADWRRAEAYFSTPGAAGNSDRGKKPGGDPPSAGT